MNENYYYWEDRFVDILKRHAPVMVCDTMNMATCYDAIEDTLGRCGLFTQFVNFVSPALRLAVRFDRPDLVAPLLQSGDGSPATLDNVTWEDKELVHLMLSTGAKQRFGHIPLIEMIRGEDYDPSGILSLYEIDTMLGDYDNMPSILESIVWFLWLENNELLAILEEMLKTGVIDGDASGEVWKRAFADSVDRYCLETVKIFLKYGADPNMVFDGRPIILATMRTIDDGPVMLADMQMVDGRPVMPAKAHGNISGVFNALIAAGAQFSWDTGGTRNGVLFIATYCEALSFVRDLLPSALASGDLSTRIMEQLFQIAVDRNNTELARLFLDAGVYVDAALESSFFTKSELTSTPKSLQDKDYGDDEQNYTAGDPTSRIKELRCRLDLGASPGEAMYLAAKNGDMRLLIWMLDHGVDVNTPNKHGETALIGLSSSWFDAQNMAFVIERGANVNHVTYNGSTALSLSVRKYHIVKMLLDAGADPNAGFGMNPLMNAVWDDRTKVVELLLQAGANVNTVLEDGETAWRIADRRGHKEIAKLLEEAGAREPDLSHTDLRAAILWGHTDDALRLIDDGADLEQLDTYGRTPLLTALLEGCDPIIAERLLAKGANPNCSIGNGCDYVSPLIFAINHGQMNLARLLLRHGAAPGIGFDLPSPLHCAILYCWQRDQDHQRYEEGVAIVRDLLEAGALTNAGFPSDILYTLSHVIQFNDMTLLRLLMEHAQAPEVLHDRSLHTFALGNACYEKNSEAVQYLLECGVNPNAFYHPDGRFPLLCACEHNDTLQTNHPDVLNNESERSDIHNLPDNFTTLHDYDERACRIVKLLLDHGADVNLDKGDRKYSALRAARRVSILTEPRCEMIRLLLDAGAAD